MERVLIVGTDTATKTIDRLLVPHYYDESMSTSCGARARRALSSLEYDLVVINAPLEQDNATTLARYIAQEGGITTILLTQTEPDSYEDGVITLVKPIDPAVLKHTLSVVGIVQRQVVALREENRRMRMLLEEARLIGRAKCVLVAFEHMSESEAHHFIEKQAMDSRLPKRVVAKDILQKYKTQERKSS